MSKPTPSEIAAMRPWNRPDVAEDPYLRKSSIDQHLGHLRVLGQGGAETVPAPWVYSASQLRTYHDCPRKWFFAKVLRYPEPASEAADLGKRVHAQVEKYIKDGTWPESPLAELLLQNLEGIDLAREDLTVEGHVKFMVWPGQPGLPWIQGFLDLTIPGFRPIVWDHKTTADLKWAKSEHELHHDLQMIVYAHWVLARLPHLSEVEVVHSYVSTRGVPEQRVVRAVLTRAEVAERWAEIQQLIEEMERVRALGDVRKVSVNMDACGKYGGCPHAGVCARAQMGQEVQVFNPPDAAREEGQETIEMNEDIKARLEALRAKASGGAPAPTPPTQVEQKLAESVAPKPEPVPAEAVALAQQVAEIVAAPSPEPERAPEPVKESGAKPGVLVWSELPELSDEVKALGLGGRATRALRTLGAVTLEALKALDASRAAEVEGCGPKVVAEIQAAQTVLGLVGAPAPEQEPNESGTPSKSAWVPVPAPAIDSSDLLAPSNLDLTLSQIANVARALGLKITIEVAP